MQTTYRFNITQQFMSARPWVAQVATALLALVVLLLAPMSAQQATSPDPTPADLSASSANTELRSETSSAGRLPSLCVECVRENLSYLASPALHGRGSGTEDEYHAAEFIARKLKQYGLQPAAENGEYIQTVTIKSREVIGTPMLSAGGSADAKQGPTVWAHGKDVAFASIPVAEASGALQKIDLSTADSSAERVKEGAAVVLKLKPGTTLQELQRAIAPVTHSKAAIVMFASGPELKGVFRSMTTHPPRTPRGDEKPDSSAVSVMLDQRAFDYLWSLPEGSPVRSQAQLGQWNETHTWNVVAKIPGEQEDHAILLSAHLDHLGTVKGKMYPGADDDASGTTAVMELARAMAKEPKPRRTIIAALWGSEEAGLIGSRYFLQHPTFPLKNLVANLEFEMIARLDPAVKPDQLWLTGWDRSNLGPELASHGAKLVADPHPAQNFFQRSDNYALAQKGIVAQTVSSFGLHKDYHEPGDTLAKVNWTHLDEAISSMIAPLQWLANSDFVPEWKTGGQP